MGRGSDDRREGLTPFDGAGGDFENDPTPLFEGTPLPPVFENGGGDILIDPSPGKEDFNVGAVAGAATPVRDPGTIAGVGGSIPPATHACLGCGYCCSKAPCPYSLDRYCVAHPCPGLVWDGERYRCAHVEDPKLRRCCAIGAGCCSPLNTWRGDKILRREHIESDRPPR